MKIKASCYSIDKSTQYNSNYRAIRYKKPLKTRKTWKTRKTEAIVTFAN